MQLATESDYVYDLGKPRGNLGYMDTEIRLGNRLKALRDEQKWTQEDVATRLVAYGVTVSQSTIGHIENGRRLPSLDVLVALARLFDTSTDYLLGVTEIELSIEDIEENAQEMGGRLQQVVARLPELRRDQLWEYANYLAMLEYGALYLENWQKYQSVLSVMQRRFGESAVSAALAEATTEFAWFDDAVAAQEKQKPLKKTN